MVGFTSGSTEVPEKTYEKDDDDDKPHTVLQLYLSMNTDIEPNVSQCWVYVLMVKDQNTHTKKNKRKLADGNIIIIWMLNYMEFKL